MTFARGLGMALTVLGGVAAILVSLWITANPASLWALIAVAITVSVISVNPKYSLWAGFTGFAGGVMVAVAVFLTSNAVCLWALLGVALIVDAVDGSDSKTEDGE